METQPEAQRQRFDGRGVAIGLPAAQAVVEVGDLKSDVETCAGREQQESQAGRVGAAGNRGHDPRPRRDQPVAGAERQGFPQQTNLSPAPNHVRNWDRVFFRCSDNCPKESTICFIRITAAIVSRAAAWMVATSLTERSESCRPS